MLIRIVWSVVLTLCMSTPFTYASDCDRLWVSANLNPPELLSEVGVFQDLKTLKPCEDVMPYSVNSPLWSDGADKKRWVIVPPRQTIHFEPEDPWLFPKQSVFIKHFEFDAPGVKPIRVETRISRIDESGQWLGYSYRWKEDQSDAILLREGATADVALAKGAPLHGQQKQKWIYPSRSMCLQCHNTWSGGVLGLRTEQLNHRFTDGSVTHNLIDSWAEKGLFSKPIPPADQLKQYVNLHDPQASREQRVRSYLAVNCAHCHQPGSAVRGSIDLRFKTSLADTQTVNTDPNLGDLNLDDPVIIKPGDKEGSVLWLRMSRSTTQHMPLIGTSITDQEAVDLVGDWINQMSTR